MTRKAEIMSSWPLDRKSGQSPALSLHGPGPLVKVRRHSGALCSPSLLCPGLARVLQTARLRTGLVGFSTRTPHTAHWVPPESRLGSWNLLREADRSRLGVCAPEPQGGGAQSGLRAPPSLEGRGEEMPEPM